MVVNSLLAKVFNAATGNSMSISCKSWLNLFKVTPVSVEAKKDVLALQMLD
jgi:hypothetical protein